MAVLLERSERDAAGGGVSPAGLKESLLGWFLSPSDEMGQGPACFGGGGLCVSLACSRRFFGGLNRRSSGPLEHEYIQVSTSYRMPGGLHMAPRSTTIISTSDRSLTEGRAFSHWTVLCTWLIGWKHKLFVTLL